MRLDRHELLVYSQNASSLKTLYKLSKNAIYCLEERKVFSNVFSVLECIWCFYWFLEDKNIFSRFSGRFGVFEKKSFFVFFLRSGRESCLGLALQALAKAVNRASVWLYRRWPRPWIVRKDAGTSYRCSIAEIHSTGSSTIHPTSPKIPQNVFSSKNTTTLQNNRKKYFYSLKTNKNVKYTLKH